MGQTPDPADPLNGNPAVLQMITRLDGSANGKILTGYGDIYFKNIYVIGADDHGVQTYYQPIEIEANNLHCVFDGCYFERSNYAITAWNGKNNDIKFTNCKWLNLVERPITQQWTGRGITCWADQDSVIIENCTFQNVGMCAVQIEGGSAKYLRFVHNTLINVGRSIHSTSGNWWRDAYFANNLLINTFFDGEGWGDYSPQAAPSRTTVFTGLMAISHLPDSYGPDLGRRIVFAKTASFLAHTFKKEWADTVRIQPYFNSVTDSFFTTFNVSNGGSMYAKDTTWLTKMPSFTNYDTSNYANMIKFIGGWLAGFIAQVILRPLQRFFPTLFRVTSPERRSLINEAAYVLNRLVRALLLAQKPLEAFYCGFRDLNLAERVPPSEAMARGYATMAMVVGVGPFGGLGRAWSDRAIGLARALGGAGAVTYCLSRSGSTLGLQGAWQTANERVAEAEAIARSRSDLRQLGEAVTLRALLQAFAAISTARLLPRRKCWPSGRPAAMVNLEIGAGICPSTP